MTRVWRVGGLGGWTCWHSVVGCSPVAVCPTKMSPWVDPRWRFTTADHRRVVTILFMRDREPVHRRFVQLDGADAVELPYQGGRLAMWLIAPHDPGGLAAVEESLTSQDLTGLAVIAQQCYVDLTMSKWEQTLPPTDLFEWLWPMGFCEGAPLENIAPQVMITAALDGCQGDRRRKRHRSAAAATAMIFLASPKPKPILTVVADCPFLWTIIHQETGVLLFRGRWADPTT